MSESVLPVANLQPAPRHLRTRPVLGEIRDWQLPGGGSVASIDTSRLPGEIRHFRKKLVALGIVILVALSIPTLVVALIVIG
ncbi:hypothetical protein GCM10023063_11870 [Arthrobacter methylotrophus]|uniref:ABC transporter permease n=1 Tax=Arthrobacter methylotrophus TaxID=121291 RepID=A0ABV5URY0_9MICC